LGPVKRDKWRLHGPTTDVPELWKNYEKILYGYFAGGQKAWVEQVESIMWKCWKEAKDAFNKKKMDQKCRGRKQKMQPNPKSPPAVATDNYGFLSATRSYPLTLSPPAYPRQLVERAPSTANTVVEAVENRRSSMLGLNHSEIWEARSLRILPSVYAQAKNSGVSPQQYSLFKCNNMTLYDCVTAKELGMNMERYKRFIEKGPTTEDV
jgi:hypothetical protein